MNFDRRLSLLPELGDAMSSLSPPVLTRTARFDDTVVIFISRIGTAYSELLYCPVDSCCADGPGVRGIGGAEIVGAVLPRPISGFKSFSVEFSANISGDGFPCIVIGDKAPSIDSICTSCIEQESEVSLSESSLEKHIRMISITSF